MQDIWCDAVQKDHARKNTVVRQRAVRCTRRVSSHNANLTPLAEWASTAMNVSLGVAGRERVSWFRLCSLLRQRPSAAAEGRGQTKMLSRLRLSLPSLPSIPSTPSPPSTSATPYRTLKRDSMTAQSSCAVQYVLLTYTLASNPPHPRLLQGLLPASVLESFTPPLELFHPYTTKHNVLALTLPLAQ